MEEDIVIEEVGAKGAHQFAADSGDVFWQTEASSNLLVAKGSIGVCVLLLGILIGELAKVFYAGLLKMAVLLTVAVVLMIPLSVYCIRCKGERRWLKYAMMLSVVIVFAVLNGSLSYIINMLWPIPVVLSVRYYSVRFTRQVAVACAVFYAISTWIGESMDFCYVDLNCFLLPANVTITTQEEIGLYDALINAGIETVDRVYYAMTLSYIPYMMEFILVSMICVSVARHGRKMTIMQAEITAEATRVESELTFAADIQSSALPREFPAFPEHREIKLYGLMDPAKEVGGDFYDYFQIDDDHVAIVMADVSGKGVPAALFMMTGKMTIENCAKPGSSPAEVFTSANRQISKGNDNDLFITAWLGILEISTGKLRYVNAGHCPPLLRKAGEESFRYLKEVHGVMLAFFDDTEYEQSEIRLAPGDELLLYTDGVTETTNAQGEQYGYERLAAFMGEHGHDALDKLLPAVREQIDAFAGDAPQFDDVTMLMLRMGEKQAS